MQISYPLLVWEETRASRKKKIINRNPQWNLFQNITFYKSPHSYICSNLERNWRVLHLDDSWYHVISRANLLHKMHLSFLANNLIIVNLLFPHVTMQFFPHLPTGNFKLFLSFFLIMNIRTWKKIKIVQFYSKNTNLQSKATCEKTWFHGWKITHKPSCLYITYQGSKSVSLK